MTARCEAAGDQGALNLRPNPSNVSLMCLLGSRRFNGNVCSLQDVEKLHLANKIRGKLRVFQPRTADIPQTAADQKPVSVSGQIVYRASPPPYSLHRSISSLTLSAIIRFPLLST